ncbi:MAG: hypothetical protein ACRDJS_08575 [Actinomycetota bacterium]
MRQRVARVNRVIDAGGMDSEIANAISDDRIVMATVYSHMSLG